MQVIIKMEWQNFTHFWRHYEMSRGKVILPTQVKTPARSSPLNGTSPSLRRMRSEYWSMAVWVTWPGLGGIGAPPNGRILYQGSLKGFLPQINPLRSLWYVRMGALDRIFVVGIPVKATWLVEHWTGNQEICGSNQSQGSLIFLSYKGFTLLWVSNKTSKHSETSSSFIRFCHIIIVQSNTLLKEHHVCSSRHQHPVYSISNSNW
jgi:hypothetical protein